MKIFHNKFCFPLIVIGIESKEYILKDITLDVINYYNEMMWLSNQNNGT